MPIVPILSHPSFFSFSLSPQYIQSGGTFPFRLGWGDHKMLLRLTYGGACASHVNPTVLLMICQNYNQTSTSSTGKSRLIFNH